MARRKFRYDPHTDRCYEVRLETYDDERVYTQPDLAPYKSMITGEMITGRAQHREHLRRHGCQEVGNERPDMTMRPMPGPSKEEVRDSIREAKRQVEWGEAPSLERLRDESPRWRRDMGLE